MEKELLYRRLAALYLEAIKDGTLAPGSRFPSVRGLMRRHAVSLSTALQVCRQLEFEGWLEARPRSGYFVRPPRRTSPPVIAEPPRGAVADPAQFVGLQVKVSEFIARGRQQLVTVNFSGARGAAELYPGAALKNAATRILRQRPDLLVTPGAPNGEPEFRSVLVRRAMDEGMRLSADDIVVTQGCIEALHLALRAVTQPGDTVAVESPSFYGLLQVLENLGLKALEIPTSPQTGISLEALELALQTQAALKALVVVPHLQNPLGCIMPDENKARLVALCSACGLPLIEDDTYSPLVDREVPLRALKSWDDDGNVIHCVSLHKVLAPGLRLGWMTAGRWQARVEMLKYAQSRNNEALAQLAAASFLASPAYDRHLRRLRLALRHQREQMAESVALHFPAGTRMNAPEGGLSLWIELVGGLSSRQLFDAALAEGILIAPGLMFSNSSRYENFIRLSCGAPYSVEVAAAVRRLGELCMAMPGQGGR